VTIQLFGALLTETILCTPFQLPFEIMKALREIE